MKTKVLSFNEILEVLKNDSNFLKGSSFPPNERIFSTTSANASLENKENAIFFALKGSKHDGHHFLETVLKNPSFKLIICEDDSFLLQVKSNLPYIKVKNARRAWAFIEDALNDNPSLKLKNIAVTGTNGKSSTTWYCHQIFKFFKKKSLLIGTLGAFFDDEKLTLTHTTPDPHVLYPLLKKAVDKGCSYFITEASSHAIAQEKLSPIAFDAKAFTSFSQDHLDFHPSMQDYFETKFLLFKNLKKQDAKIYLSDCLGDYLSFFKEDKLLRPHATLYQVEEKSGFFPRQISATILSQNSTHTTLALRFSESKDLMVKNEVNLLAKFMLENFLCAFLICKDFLKDEIGEGHYKFDFENVPGRMEKISKKNIDIYIDYAHTPDALEKALQALRPLCHGRLLCVFGCGGDRDKEKRILMGDVAEKLSDIVFVTSDNPRTENPQAIADDILKNIKSSSKVHLVLERRDALLKALNLCQEKDILLVAGKGHETYQIIGERKVSFDDREVIGEFFKE